MYSIIFTWWWDASIYYLHLVVGWLFAVLYTPHVFYYIPIRLVALVCFFAALGGRNHRPQSVEQQRRENVTVRRVEESHQVNDEVSPLSDPAAPLAHGREERREAHCSRRDAL